MTKDWERTRPKELAQYVFFCEEKVMKGKER